MYIRTYVFIFRYLVCGDVTEIIPVSQSIKVSLYMCKHIPYVRTYVRTCVHHTYMLGMYYVNALILCMHVHTVDPRLSEQQWPQQSKNYAG